MARSKAKCSRPNFPRVKKQQWGKNFIFSHIWAPILKIQKCLWFFSLLLVEFIILLATIFENLNAIWSCLCKMVIILPMVFISFCWNGCALSRLFASFYFALPCHIIVFLDRLLSTCSNFQTFLARIVLKKKWTIFPTEFCFSFSYSVNNSEEILWVLSSLFHTR